MTGAREVAAAGCSIAFTCFGARIAVRSNDAALLEQLIPFLPPQRSDAPSTWADVTLASVVESSAVSPSYRLYRDADLLVATPDVTRLVDRFASEIHHQVAIHARDALFVHAGVVAWHRHALILPGRSFAGKSHLVAALVARGALYYSDEYAVIDGSGLVYPYPKLIGLRRTSGSARQWVSPEDLGSRGGSETVPVGLVALTRYAEGAIWQPEELPPGRAVLALLDNTVLARTHSAIALPLFGMIATRAPAIASARGDAAETAAHLIARLDAVLTNRIAG